MNGFGQRFVRRAALDEPADEEIGRAMVVDEERPFRRCLARRQHVRQHGPLDREISEHDVGHGVALAGDQGNRLAAKADMAFSKRRLVGERRDGAETIAAGDVARGKDGDDAFMSCDEGGGVADREGGAMMRRTHDQHRQRIGRKCIGAEALAAGHLGLAVEPDRRRADGAAAGRHAAIERRGMA